MTSSRAPRAVIDTNVFISGLLFNGNPGKILKLFRDQRFELVISPEIGHEFLSKLDAFGVPDTLIEEFKDLIDGRATYIVPPVIDRKSRNPKDDMFLAAAAEAGADVIVTGDKDLLSLHSYRGISIVTPRQFLADKRQSDQRGSHR